MIKPLTSYIAVRPIVRQLSDVIVVQNREPFNEGEVINVGPEVYEVKPGDRIRYGNGEYLDWDGVEINGETVQFIVEADVAAIVEAA